MRTRHRILIVAGAMLLGGCTLTGALAADTAVQNVTNKVRGQDVYNHWCAPCHAAGPGHPGTQSLQIKYSDNGPPAVLEQRKDLTPEFVQSMVRQGILLMAPFRKTEITDAELADIAAYLSKQ